MKRHLAFLSGAPRVSTKPMAEATGARQHVLGTIAGFEQNGWQVSRYIVGDKVPESWISAGQQKELNNSRIKRLAADALRLALTVQHALLSQLKMKPTPEWVYERYGALQMLGWLFQRRGSKWIIETNNPFFHEAASDRKSIALPFLVKKLEKYAYRKCDALVVISEDLKRIIVQALGVPEEKIIVLPNAADTDLFNPHNVAAIRFFPDQFVIGFQGNFYKWAGLEYLVRAVKHLRDEGLPIAAVLLGDGQERHNLEKLAAQLGVADFIKFPGRVPREEVPRYIAGYDLCFSGQINLSTGSMYHSPLKLYDYMAMGKPVLASAHDDAKKLTQHGRLGYLFAPESLDDLVATARYAYTNRAALAAMGEAARLEIVANHSWRGRIRELIAMLEARFSVAAASAAPKGSTAVSHDLRTYSPFERAVNKALERFPFIRRYVRDAYYLANYLRYREVGFTAATSSRLLTAAEWAGVDEPLTESSFFGYYDKSPFSADGTMLLQHEGWDVGMPVTVLAYDKALRKRHTLGSTMAWMWQQGAQATWLTGLGAHVAGYNTVENDRLGLAIIDLDGGSHRFVPFPIQSLLPDGRTMLSLNYCRLARTAPDYGYAIEVSNFTGDMPLEQDGVWKVDLTTSESTLILSLATLANLQPLPSMKGAEHYVNHCVPRPNGTDYLVIHRWVTPMGQTLSRLLLAPVAGGAPRLLLDNGKVSHYCWRNDSELIAWTRTPEHGDQYHLIHADTGAYQPFGHGTADVYGDGHGTFTTDGRYFLSDSYPDKKRQQHLFIYDSQDKRRLELGRFLSPWPFREVVRCDLHPRFDHNQELISFDSAHSGERRSYVIEWQR